MAPDGAVDQFLNELTERRQLRSFPLFVVQMDEWPRTGKLLRLSCDSPKAHGTFLLVSETTGPQPELSLHW
jgi:hypothetical protein